MHVILILFYTLLPLFLSGEKEEHAASVPSFSFENTYQWVRYDKNELAYKGHAEKQFDFFFQEFSSFRRLPDRQFHILQFGDSHVQADYFGEQLRERLRRDLSIPISDRGILFPYSIAQSNNPAYLSMEYQGVWQTQKATLKDLSIPLGLTGYAAVTSDEKASIEIALNPWRSKTYDFCELTIFHTPGREIPQPYFLLQDDTIRGYTNVLSGITRFEFDQFLDSIHIEFDFSQSKLQEITVYGILAQSDRPGLVFSSLGVNGADIQSVNRCSLLSDQLRMVNPDMIIFSFGTNDVFHQFKRDIFLHQYELLLGNIRKMFPDIPIILTTPGDCKREQQSIPEVKEVGRMIERMAEKYDCAYWDFYRVMGGMGAIDLWFEAGLAKPDKVHLTKKGYEYQADLFFSAFLNRYNQTTKF